jgi:hypothetical protein
MRPTQRATHPCTWPPCTPNCSASASSCPGTPHAVCTLLRSRDARVVIHSAAAAQVTPSLPQLCLCCLAQHHELCSWTPCNTHKKSQRSSLQRGCKIPIQRSPLDSLGHGLPKWSAQRFYRACKSRQMNCASSFVESRMRTRIVLLEDRGA